MEKADNITVMFADFAGSTRLYERFGNEKANATIEHVINLMSSIVQEYNGSVIKTIGDELMCRFNNPNDAVKAACQIQNTIDALPAIEGFRLAVRIGMHTGEILLTPEGDVYGDTVNVAARITSKARARQIFATDVVIHQLEQKLKAQARPFDVLSVKGKSAKQAVHQVIWEENDVTMLASNMNLVEEEGQGCLRIYYDDEEIHLASEVPCIMIGREVLCDLVIDSSYVSRFHARIEYRRGRYVLVDQSTNGTFVRFRDGPEIFLRGDEVTLLGHGIISIGKTIDTDDALHVVRFSFGDG